MWISSLELTNIKSFASSGAIALDKKMNVFIGPNNAGKSIVVKALHLLQNHNLLTGGDLRYGEYSGQISIELANVTEEFYIKALGIDQGSLPKVYFDLRSGGLGSILTLSPVGKRFRVNPFPQREPNNFVYPFLSKRKVTSYEQVVNRSRTETIIDNFTHLVSRVDRVSKPTYKDYQEYEEAVKKIVGFSLSTMPSEGGHEIGFPLGRTGGVSLERMGEGIPNLLALITDLCGTENKLFVIEEPENDIHPSALKSLLNLIIQKSETNQFIVTTHSNIVAKYLGSITSAKLFRVNMNFNASGVPTSECDPVDNTPESRRAVLEELGYEMTDYDLWKGWLILEESTAERLINDFLLPNFAPKLLGKLRTISSQGADEVKAKFKDFDRLFLFTHLAQSYINKAWVVIDGGERESEIVKQLRTSYAQSGWKEDRFRNLNKHNFELYYPTRFKSDVDNILKMPHGKIKQDAKSELMKKVLKWSLDNQDEAKKEFQISANEIIGLLVELEKELN